MAASALACTVLFLAWPELDLLASAAFYDGTGFVLRGHPFFDFVHRYVGILAGSIALAAALILGGAGRIRRLARRRRAAVFMLLVLLLGPGLVVNVLLKDHWGRARPGQVADYGGAAQFTPAWVVSDQCRHNCSFVCGDASVGFSLAALAFVARHPRRWLAAGFVTGAGLGLMRMAQGGHFLSDVVFAFYAVWFTAWALARIMAKWGGPLGPPD